MQYCVLVTATFVGVLSSTLATMKMIFKSIEGLSEKMVLAPTEVVNDYYDVLVVDEAHRLYRRKHLPGGHIYSKFDSINKQLMGNAFKRDESDLTELDWIIQSSRTQVLFYDDWDLLVVVKGCSSTAVTLLLSSPLLLPPLSSL